MLGSGHGVQHSDGGSAGVRARYELACGAEVPPSENFGELRRTSENPRGSLELGACARYYLLDDAEVKAKIDGVANQGKVQHVQSHMTYIHTTPPKPHFWRSRCQVK